MFILGMLSIIQITFLPGILILKKLKMNKGIIQTLVYSFALSLIFNHLYVVMLTHLGINFPLAHYILFAVEIGLFLYLFSSDLKQPIGISLEQQYKKISSNINSYFQADETDSREVIRRSVIGIAWAVFLVWAVFCLGWAVNYLTDNLGTVFKIVDSVVSWNHWATEWFSNTQPLDTKRYAQLIPTNFSVTYSFLRGTEIQLFAKGFMPLFAIYILLMMFDLGVKQKNLGFMIGLVASRYILHRFYHMFISSGYVDVAVAFFTMVTVYTLFQASKDDDEEIQLRYVFLGSIFAAGTALTKQNGLLVFAAYPVLAYWMILKDLESLSTKEKLVKLAGFFGISLLLLLPWYVFNELRIFNGADTNVIGLMTNTHKGQTRPERFVRGIKDLSIYAYLYPFIILTIPFIDKEYRKVIYLIFLPYSLIWGFFFSRYTRNLSIAYPLLGLFTGLGAAGFLVFMLDQLSKFNIQKIRSYILIVLTVFGILVGGFIFSDGVLQDIQTEDQKLVFDPEINQLLYNYFGENDYQPIFTNYQLRYVPGFEDLQVNIGGFKDYDFYTQTRADNPEVKYMLISLVKYDEKVFIEINSKIETGDYEVIFEHNRYLFVRIMNE